MKIRKCKYNFGNNNDGVFSTINGYATETNNFGETAVGILNKSTLDPDTFTSPDVVTSSKATLFSVGNGSDNVRKNAFEIKANGDTYINGVGGYDGTNSEDATSVGESIQSVQDSSNKVAEDIESIHIEKSGIGNTYVLKVAGEDRGTITDESGVSFTPGDGLQLVDTDLSVKIDPASESYLTAGQDGLKISGIDAKFGDYLPLSGGEMTGRISHNGSFFDSNQIGVAILSWRSYMDQAGFSSYGGDDGIAISLNSNRIDNWNNWGAALSGLNIRTENGITRYGPNGVSLPKKTASDLLNAAGSTTPISNIATQVQAAIVDSAPETLDTLNELAAALGDDPNFATTVTNLIGTKVDNSKWETIANIVTTISDFSYAEDSIQLNHKFILKNDNGSFSSENTAGKKINAATSTTAGVLTAEDFKKLSNITLGENGGISGINFNAGPTDAATFAIETEVNDDATTFVFRLTDNIPVQDKIQFRTSEWYNGGVNHYTPVQITDILESRNPTTNKLERVANISELPSVVTTSADGLMSAADKQKLDGLSNYTLPTASATQLGGIRVGDGLEITGEGVLNCTIDPGSGTVSWDNIQGKPTFSTVATSGLYSDLTGTPDLSNYVTSTQLTSIAGSNTYTGANYISKETNLTDAVVQLDEEIKATNDNLALEHANAEATYVKKTELKTINSQSLLGEGNIEIQVEGGGITDAPSDNKLYGRKNAQWTEVTVPEVEVPTKVSQLTNDSGFQTEAQVSAKISALVDSAPETLDTLNELAAALGDDPNFATTIITQLGNKLDTSTYNSDKATFALKSELPDMSNYALKSELPSVESITTTDINALFS